MNKPKMMPSVCGLCQKAVTTDNPFTRDHVFPQGLGEFTNAFIAPLCRECNTKIGKKLEEAVFHSSYVAVIRALLRIRSKNSIKNQLPHRNPLPPESERKAVDPLADVTVEWKGQTLHARAVTENGHVDLPDVLFIERKDEEPLILSVADKGIDQIVAMAFNAIAGTKANIELYHKDPAIIQEWQKRMAESGFMMENMSIEPPSALLKGHVHGTMEETHLRTHGYWLLKGMLCAGIDPKLLANLANYVHTGVYNPKLCWSTFKGFGSPNPKQTFEQHLFGHHIEWFIFTHHFQGIVTVFATEQHATITHFKVMHGEDARQIIIPGPGAIKAGYYKDGPAGAGWCEHIQRREILQSSRPAGVEPVWPPVPRK